MVNVSLYLFVHFLETFYDLVTVRNLKEVLQKILVFTDHSNWDTMIEISGSDLDIPNTPFVFNNRFIIDLGRHIPLGTAIKYISFLPADLPNTTLAISLVDKVQI